MAVTADCYSRLGVQLAQARINFLTDTIKVMLLGTGYTPDAKAHESYNDIKANEVASGNGYTTRGVALGTKSVAYDSTADRTRLFAANAVWTPGAGQTLTARHAAIYKDSGTDNTSWLMGFVDFGASVSALGAAFTVQWDATDGVLYLDGI